MSTLYNYMIYYFLLVYEYFLYLLMVFSVHIVASYCLERLAAPSGGQTFAGRGCLKGTE